MKQSNLSNHQIAVIVGYSEKIVNI